MIIDSYRTGSIIKNEEKLIDPLKSRASKAGGVLFNKSSWFKQSPYQEQFTPEAYNDGPVVETVNINTCNFFRANITDSNYLASLEMNMVI